MLGLAVMLVALLYFVILFTATIGSYLLLRKSKKNRKVSALVSLIIFSAIFVPVFWDYYPTKWAHDYYCKNEAGFFQYKTIEQWKAENPNVLETLQPYPFKNRGENSKHIVVDGEEYYSRYMNKRISIYSLNGWKSMGFNIRKSIHLLYDEDTKSILAKQVEFYTGPGNTLELGGKGASSYKIWLNQPPCGDGNFYSVVEQFSNQSLKEGISYDQ